MQQTQEMGVPSLGRKDPLAKEMATCSSILAWKIPGTEEPGRLQSKGSQRAGHNWGTKHTDTWLNQAASPTPSGWRWVPSHQDKITHATNCKIGQKTNDYRNNPPCPLPTQYAILQRFFLKYSSYIISYTHQFFFNSILKYIKNIFIQKSPLASFNVPFLEW